ncbi:MAG: hypothetical protein GC137_10435 [Alphaproteobacteria bacterium]|nr:hypothetical protein [Alphaproteobacteria bacterium]
MNKSQISLSLALAALVVWGIHNYDVNSSCFEIAEVGLPLNSSVMIDKCKGKTWALVNDVREVYSYDEEGYETSKKIKTLVWTRIHREDGTLSYGDIEE